MSTTYKGAPGATAIASEGEANNNPNHQIGASSMSTLATTAVMHDHFFDADRQKVLVERLDAWNDRADTNVFDASKIMERVTPQEPAWADESYFLQSPVPSGSAFASRPVRLPLSRHRGNLTDAAQLELQLVHGIRMTEPKVYFERKESTTKNRLIRTAEGSGYSLSLEEAAEFAHLILLALDVARVSQEAE